MTAERCDPEIFEHGERLCVITGPRATTIEPWIVKVRDASGQRVDWHYSSGYAQVLVIGDKQRVRETMTGLAVELITAYLSCSSNFSPTPSPRDVVMRFL